MKHLAVLFVLVASLAFSQTASDLNSGLILKQERAEGYYTLSWWGELGREYYVQQSEDLVRWRFLPVAEQGYDAPITWGLNTNAERMFFKITHVPSGPNSPQLTDSDGDGISNWDEVQDGSNPFNEDSDGDGSFDDEEKNSNTDPSNPESKPELLDPADYVEVQARSIIADFQDVSGQIEHSWWIYYSELEEPSYLGTWQPANLGYTEYLTTTKRGSASYSDNREPPVFDNLNDSRGPLGQIADVENGWYSAYGPLAVTSTYAFTSQGSGGGPPPAGAYSNGETWDVTYRTDSALNWSGGVMEVRLKWKPNKPRAERLSPVTMTFLKDNRENGEEQSVSVQTLTIDPNSPTSVAGGEQNNGAITLKADTIEDDKTVTEALLPIQVRDGDRVMTSLPLNEDPWTTANLQKQIPDSTIALIKPHDGFGDRPEMPHIEISIPQAQTSLEVSWKIEIEYKRGNGYRASYVQDFSRPEDKLRLPELEAGADDMLAPRPASEVWKVWESSDWERQIDENGFFGGLAKVYAIFSSNPSQPPKEVFRFRIGGENPEEAKARQYIDLRAGATYWYAYAVAKHETFGRVRGRFYNHFYTDYRQGPVGDNSVDMGLAAWAKAWPLYNLDRGKRTNGTRYQNGPGGYGLFQLTLGPKTPGGSQSSEGFVTRAQIWNWQENCNRAVTELQGKLTKAIDLESGLEGGNPTWPQVDAATYGRFNGREAIVLTYYNGMFGGELERVKVTNGRSWSCWKPMGTTNLTWHFLQNVNDYVQHVNSHIE